MSIEPIIYLTFEDVHDLCVKVLAAEQESQNFS